MNQRDPLLDSVNTTYADKGRTNDVICFRNRWIALVFLLDGAHIPLDWKYVRADHLSIYPTLKVLLEYAEAKRSFMYIHSVQ